MQYNVVMFLLVLVILVFTLMSTAIYAEHPPLVIGGTVTSHGCRVLGGTTEPYAYGHGPQIATLELCKSDIGNFIIANYESCRESIKVTKEFQPGTVYEFPTSCDLPRTCNLAFGWGYVETDTPYSNNIRVKVDEKQFHIVIQSRAIVCDAGFNPDSKAIAVDVRGLNGTNASITVNIPYEVLDGEYKVSVDGSPTDFEIKNTETHSEITVAFNFPEATNNDVAIVSRNIIISGSTAIPEFPIAIIIASVAIGSMLAITRSRNIRLFLH